MGAVVTLGVQRQNPWGFLPQIVDISTRRLEDDIVKRFGFLSFGHYSLKPDKTGKYGAQEALKQAVELGQIAETSLV